MSKTGHTADGGRGLKQQVFIQVCRDSGFRLDAIDAAHLAARVIGCSPLELWTAVGSLVAMDAIANGSHPAALSKAQPENGATP